MPATHEALVRRAPFDWPQGTWHPFADPAAALDTLNVAVGQITRKRLHFNPWDGQWCLMAKTLLRLKSNKAAYGFTYVAGNDWEREGWDDKRRVTASLPGLGMNTPAGQLWQLLPVITSAKCAGAQHGSDRF